MENLQLAKIANQVRKDIVTGVYNAKSGHPGGSLSAADMLTFLYFEEMNVSPEKAKEQSDALQNNAVSEQNTAEKAFSNLLFSFCFVF